MSKYGQFNYFEGDKRTVVLNDVTDFVVNGKDEVDGLP